MTGKILDILGLSAGSVCLVTAATTLFTPGAPNLMEWLTNNHVLKYSLLAFACWIICHIGSRIEASYFTDGHEKSTDIFIIYSYLPLYQAIFPLFFFMLFLRYWLLLPH